MSDKNFIEMNDEEQLADLRERVNQFMMLQLPGQPMGMHIGTSYLVSDLLRTVERLAKG